MNDGRLKGGHVLAISLAFFGLIIGANATMVTFALTTFSGVEESDAYQKGLNYNQALARKAAEEKSGYTAALDVVRGTDGTAQITVRLQQHATPAAGLTVTAMMRHPTDSHRDNTIMLQSGSEGQYAGISAVISPGAWDVIVEARRDDVAVLSSRQRVWLP